MSADDLIRDPATIRASDEPDRDDRYWAAITRDRSVGSVDAVTRLADSEQAATVNRLDHAEARVDALLTERDDLRAQIKAMHRLADLFDSIADNYDAGSIKFPTNSVTARSVAGRIRADLRAAASGLT